jgi:hypothetical protein
MPVIFIGFLLVHLDILCLFSFFHLCGIMAYCNQTLTILILLYFSLFYLFIFFASTLFVAFILLHAIMMTAIFLSLLDVGTPLSIFCKANQVVIIPSVVVYLEKSFSFGFEGEMRKALLCLIGNSNSWQLFAFRT